MQLGNTPNDEIISFNPYPQILGVGAHLFQVIILIHQRTRAHIHPGERARLRRFSGNTLYPTTYTLYPIPYTLYPIPYTLQPIPYTLQPTTYTIYPVP